MEISAISDIWWIPVKWWNFADISPTSTCWELNHKTEWYGLYLSYHTSSWTVQETYSELSFGFPAECSGAGPSTHHASRDRKKFGDISLSQIQLSFFPEGLRYAHWEWKMWVRGHNDFSFHLKQTNSIYLAHTYIHMLKNHHTAEKNIFCFKDYLHF